MRELVLDVEPDVAYTSRILRQGRERTLAA
jgi:hypothetical protein